jgi:hypothetical protein
MNASSFTRRSLLLCAGMLLASCGGSGGGTTGGGGGPPAPLYAVGGTMSGLQGVVVLRNNGGDDVTVSANGAFQFATTEADGAAFAITVSTQPTSPAQTCSVANGSGAVAGADARGATVTCTTNTYFINPQINGLLEGLPIGGGLVLQDNGTDDTTIYNPGGGVTAFYNAFQTQLPSGATYRVTVKMQPSGETCSVSNGSGTVGASVVNDIVVTCVPNAPTPCISTYASYVNTWLPVLRTNGTVVTHASNVTVDETWAGDGTVHVIPNSINIVAPATVTIQPCATVKIASGAGIDVRGNAAGGTNAKLVANGGVLAGDLSPVVFQNMNGDLTPRWGRLRGLDKNSLVELHWTYLFGGGNVGGSQLNAVLSMNGTSTLPDPVLKVDNVIVDAPGGAGIYFSSAAFTSDSTVLQVQDTAGASVAMPAMALGSIGAAMLGASADIQVVENANIFDNLTIATQVPIRFKTDGVHVGGLAPTFVANVTLTLGPGVTLKFQGNTGPPLVTFGDVGQAQDKNAALVVQGTALEPVLFTSGAATPQPGDWAGLYLQTSNGSQIDHAIIEYAGGDAAIGPQSCGPIDSSIHQRARNTAALIVGDGTDQQYVPPAGLVTNTTFRNNTGSYAIDAVWESGGFGPSLNATNVFGAGPKFCTQNKNLIVGGCVVAGVDQSGCLVP